MNLWSFIEKILYNMLSKILNIQKKELSTEHFYNIVQFIKFALVGISNSIISYGIYSISLMLFRIKGFCAEGDYLIAQILAFTISVLWAFYWNNKKVFVNKTNEKRSVWRSLIKTYITYSFTGLFLNSIMLILWIHIFHISEFVAPIINLLISVCLRQNKYASNHCKY